MASRPTIVDPLPDETLVSVLTRYYVLNGYASWTSMLIREIGLRRVLHPVCGLPLIPQRLPRLLGLHPEWILTELTMWNALTAFTEISSRLRLRTHLLDGTLGRLPGAKGFPLARLQAVNLCDSVQHVCAKTSTDMVAATGIVATRCPSFDCVGSTQRHCRP